MRHVVVAVVGVLVSTGGAAAQRWQDATPACLGTTAEWTNKVEVADLDGDGLVDVLLANGGNYSSPGTPEPVRVWRNLGTWGGAGASCVEISAEAVLGFTGLSRVIKAVDLDGDGDLELITGGAYQTQLRMFARTPTGWIDATAGLPQQLTSVGDLEAGDVDGDGDLDLLIADWGAANPSPTHPGGRTRLYLNNGDGTFSDATATHMPALLVKWSWEVELVDVDNDWDLDALVACKTCSTSYLFRNDGAGHFTDDPDALPHFANNYDFEPMDIDHDGDLDLVTINDGIQLREHLLVNDGTGHFTDESATRLVGAANPANADDNAAVWLDVDADGDADLLIATLGADRLLLNDGTGVFTLTSGPPNDTPGTLGIAAADLDGDGRLDLVQGQGELATADKLQLATTEVAVDTVAPSVTVEVRSGTTDVGVIHARVHDHQSPSRAHDYQRVWLEHDAAAVDMAWRGEFLWAAPALVGVSRYRACARDRQGNEACSSWVEVLAPPGDGVPDGGGGGPGSGGCCDARPVPGASTVALALAVLGLGRRRRCRRRPRRALVA